MPLPYSADVWLGEYVKDRIGSLFSNSGTSGKARVWFAITDHYEPFWKNKDESLASERVARWSRLWPEITSRHHDSVGNPPRYSFFYPEEEYRPHLLDSLEKMTRAGIGDVEIHIHHDGEGEQNFIDRMSGFKETLAAKHGLLHQQDGQTVFGFIHGNWCLDNSRPDGRWCGLNNEIQLLRKLGCYADFTMPCGPFPMQTPVLNKIYWATDDPQTPKSYERGTEVLPGKLGSGDLLMITGPFGLRWKGRLKPRFEIGELASYDMPTPYRVERWLDLSPRIGQDIFVKVFAHGTQEKHSKALLEGGLDALFVSLNQACQRRGYELRYATAWEMYQAVLAAAS